MVTITKDKLTLLVTSGAYTSIYAPAGWTIKGEEKPDKETPSISSPAPEGIITPDNDEESVEDEIEQEDEDVYASEEDLSEKPLSEMGFEELQTYAESLDIDISELRSKKSLRQAIRDHQS